MHPFAGGIIPADAAAAERARARIDQLTKPPGSLGRIERLGVRLCAIAGGLPAHRYERRAILVAAGDHGVAMRGVSAYPSDVTAQMVAGFLRGTAAINAFARTVHAPVYVADFGVRARPAPHPLLLDVRIGPGTRDLSVAPAMDPSEFDAALAAGAQAFATVRARTDAQIVALGEMGIGNTTSAAALVAALTGAVTEEVVGRGTGVDDEGLARKGEVVARAVDRVRGARPEAIAAELGGFEIVGLAGAILAAARERTPVLLDGFIVAAAALIARSLASASIDYAIAAHRSQEPGHRIALDALGLEPLLDLEFRLGEATGAALALPLVEAAARMMAEMQTFEEAGVSGREERDAATSPPK